MTSSRRPVFIPLKQNIRGMEADSFRYAMLLIKKAELTSAFAIVGFGIFEAPFLPPQRSGII
jgi:hypothetical protein